MCVEASGLTLVKVLPLLTRIRAKRSLGSLVKGTGNHFGGVNATHKQVVFFAVILESVNIQIGLFVLESNQKSL